MVLDRFPYYDAAGRFDLTRRLDGQPRLKANVAAGHFLKDAGARSTLSLQTSDKATSGNNFGFDGETEYESVAANLEEHVRRLYMSGGRTFLRSGLYGGVSRAQDSFNNVWARTVRRLTEELDANVFYLNWRAARTSCSHRRLDMALQIPHY